MKKNPYKINNYRTHVHIYRGQLIFGDAFEMIKELKKSQDPKYSEPDPFIEWDEIQLEDLKNFKAHKIIASNHHGGCWTPIFDSVKEEGNADSLFIDTAAAHLFPYYSKPDACGSKEHLKLMNEMIEKTLIKNNDYPLEKKPDRELGFPSGKILFMQSSKEVRFETKENNFKIDYSKSEEEIYEQLFKLCWNPEIKFINYEHPLESHSLDFYVDNLSFQGTCSHLIYPIKSLVEDIDWFAHYYAKFIGDEKEIHKKQKRPQKEQIKASKEWQERFLKPLGLKAESETEIEQRMQEPLINRYKDYVERHGFIHGYYIAPYDIIDTYE